MGEHRDGTPPAIEMDEQAGNRLSRGSLRSGGTTDYGPFVALRPAVMRRGSATYRKYSHGSGGFAHGLGLGPDPVEMGADVTALFAGLGSGLPDLLRDGLFL